jgi:hypothetical protein
MKCEYCDRIILNKSIKLKNGCKWCNVKYRRTINTNQEKQKKKKLIQKIIEIINCFHIDINEKIIIEKIKDIILK